MPLTPNKEEFKLEVKNFALEESKENEEIIESYLERVTKQVQVSKPIS